MRRHSRIILPGINAIKNISSYSKRPYPPAGSAMPATGRMIVRLDASLLQRLADHAWRERHMAYLDRSERPQRVFDARGHDGADRNAACFADALDPEGV